MIRNFINLMLIYLFVMNQFNYSMDKSLENKKPPLTVNIFNSGHNVGAYATADSQASAEQSTTVKLTFEQYIAITIEQSKQLIEKAHSLISLLKDFIYDYKYRISLFVLASTYSKVRYSLYKDLNYFDHQDRWSNWTVTKSVNNFYETPHNVLEKKLIHEIYYRYLNKKNPTDTIMPLVRFVTELHEELARLTHYQKRSQWIKTLKVTYFFPDHEKVDREICKKIDRLLFIKHIFISWSTSQQQLTKQLT